MKSSKQQEKWKYTKTPGHKLDMAHSIAVTILKDKCKILEAVERSAGLKATRVKKQQVASILDMKKVLWIEHQTQNWTPTPQNRDFHGKGAKPIWNVKGKDWTRI